MSRNPYKNLINNSIAFTIANLGSKIISIVMVPLYTYVLTTEEYGTVDIITTLNSLLLPIIFLSTSDAILRYAMDKRYEKKQVMSSAMCIYIVGTCILFAILPIVALKTPAVKKYILLFGALFICNGLMQALNQFLRASDHVKAFATNGVIYTFSFAGLNVLFLVKLHLGIYGYLYSMILADLVCIVYAIVISHVWKFLCFSVSKDMTKIMLRYSIPLIPNALMWWIMDASDKFVITYFLGVGANGLYAISKKLPTLIDTFHSIFNQAWQISAIQENDDPDSKEFTSRIYKMYFVFLFIVVSILLIVARPLIVYILSENYFNTWMYIPFLLVSVAFSSLSGFLSSKLIASEQTKLIFKTTIIGAIVNTGCNFLLIPLMGINGAGLATLIGFAMVMLIRERLLKKAGLLEITFSKVGIFITVSAQIVVYYLLPLWWAVGVMFIIFFLLLYFERKIIIPFIRRIIVKLLKRG